MTTFTLNQRVNVQSVHSMAAGEVIPAFAGRVVQLPVFGWMRVVDDHGRVWLRRVDECDPVSVARALHLSLARESVRVARRWFNEASGWWLNQDQVDLCRDYAHMAQRDARRHIEAAARS